MKNEDLNTLRQRLLDARQDLMARIAQQRGGALGRVEAAVEQFGQSDDEHAQNITERDLAFAIDEHESAELNAVQAALVRVREGTYGECVDCGQTISLARLQATPEAERCVPCQTQREHRH
ncbi:MAG: TraR/DksA family transcriptional regulator [Limnohabitans sp.]|jgi:DnaK suppressor protein|nr:TraR/DksA family transcriptional regulator [Limnohabitans sp.]